MTKPAGVLRALMARWATALSVVLLTLAATSVRADTERAFIGAAGFKPLDAAALERRFERVLSDAAANPGPIEKAIGVLLASERPLERVRLRVTYAQEAIQQPNGAATLVGFVEVTRFNLGPVIRRAAVKSYGAENVGPPAEFGVGPHVTVRATFSGLRGAHAVLREASRSEMSDAVAQRQRCITVSCLSEAPAGERNGWRAKAIAKPKAIARSSSPEQPSPIDMARWAMAGAGYLGERGTEWNAPEVREGLKAGEAYITMIIDQNLGQDTSVAAIMRETNLMDDDISEIWRRVASSGDSDELVVRRRR